jgi:molybdopterin molybdotransferase
VRAADVASLPARLRLVGEIRAGDALEALPQVGAGECAAIMTGAAAAPGADAIVMVEYTRREGDAVVFERGVHAGENIVEAGCESRAGDLLLPVGTRMDQAAISAAAAVGAERVQVFGKPRVAILSTGDEIVRLGAAPLPHQVRNSNSYSLAAQVMAGGGEAAILPIAPDEPGRLRELLAEGLGYDLLLVSGGVSAGQYDLVEPCLSELGAEFFFTGAKIQPGKPIVFGRAPKTGGGGSTYFFGLPGNPVSTMVTFSLFVAPLLDGLRGARPAPLVFLRARLAAEVRTKPGLTRFLPAVLSGFGDDARVEMVHWQGSGDIAATARANCYLVVPPIGEHMAAGEWVGVVVR